MLLMSAGLWYGMISAMSHHIYHPFAASCSPLTSLMIMNTGGVGSKSCTGRHCVHRTSVRTLLFQPERNRDVASHFFLLSFRTISSINIMMLRRLHFSCDRQRRRSFYRSIGCCLKCAVQASLSFKKACVGRPPIRKLSSAASG